MTYFETLKAIKKEQFSAVYLFYGTESYIIQDLKQQLTNYALSEEDKGTNLSDYDMEETPIEAALADAETFPFLGERKVVFIHNPTFLKAKPEKTAVEHDVNVLLDYLTEPAPYSIVVFIAPYEKIDERKKITKQLKKSAVSVSCEPIKEWDLPKWIDSIAGDLHVKVSKSVHDLIGQEVGSNLLSLQKEMEKMALYVGENGTITEEVAEQLVSHNSETSALKLVDAVINSQLQKAIAIFKDLEKLKEDPIALIALLSSQFRTIMQVKLLKQKGYTQNQMTQQLKVHPYVVKMAQQREKRFTLHELKHILHSFTETDTKIKQGKMEKSLAFELLLYELITIKKNNTHQKTEA